MGLQVVAYGRAGQSRVGNRHFDVVDGHQSGGTPVDLDHATHMLVNLVELNPVAHLKGLLTLDGKPSEKVAKRVLQRESHHGCQQSGRREQRARLHARSAQHREGDQHIHEELGNILYDTRKGSLGSTVDEAGNEEQETRTPHCDEKQCQRRQLQREIERRARSHPALHGLQSNMHDQEGNGDAKIAP